MATKDDAGPLLCAECKALPPVTDLMQFPDMCARCGLPMILDGVPPRAPLPEAEDPIERARRGPVPVEPVGIAARKEAIVDAGVAWYHAIKPGAANPSPVALLQRIRELLDAQGEAAAKDGKVLARYTREIDAARERGLALTAERIEAERDEYVGGGA